MSSHQKDVDKEYAEAFFGPECITDADRLMVAKSQIKHLRTRLKALEDDKRVLKEALKRVEPHCNSDCPSGKLCKCGRFHARRALKRVK